MKSTGLEKAIHKAVEDMVFDESIGKDTPPRTYDCGQDKDQRMLATIFLDIHSISYRERISPELQSEFRRQAIGILGTASEKTLRCTMNNNGPNGMTAIMIKFPEEIWESTKQDARKDLMEAMSNAVANVFRAR